MFVDASALTSLVVREPDAVALSKVLDGAISGPKTTALALFESTLAVMRVLTIDLGDARARIDFVLRQAGIEVVPITLDIGDAALAAHARYGKGSGHPARLNMGDCFAYGCAKVLGVPLLYKGDDFVHTDLA